MAGTGIRRRDIYKVVRFVVLTMVMMGCTNMLFAQSGGGKSDKPNIILFLTDDQGWVDTSVPMMKDRPDSKSDIYQTPHLEKLAMQGMRFSNAYAGGPICSPTRHSIQFGKTAARTHTTTHAGLMPMNEGLTGLPQMIKKADPDYITAHFGKWHIKRKPEDMGYDVSDGPNPNGKGNFNMLNGERIPLPDDNPKQIFSVTDSAVRFMEQQVEEGRPFYLQVSHYAPHVKHAALKSTIKKYQKLIPGDDPELELYAAMIEDLDTGLGLVLDKIDKLGISENTYIIFVSDNGGGFRGNLPLQEGKGSLKEGGIRVPMVVRGPGIKPNTFCDVPVVTWDFFPTISELINNQEPLPEGLDGGSLLPLFKNGGKGEVKRPYDFMVFHFPEWTHSYSAIRKGDYKFFMCWDDVELHLFDLSRDIEESNNLAYEMPELTEELHNDLVEYLKSVEAEDPLRGREHKRMMNLKKAKEEALKKKN